MIDLESKTAVITGGGRGIGAAAARGLSACGAEVLVASRTKSEIEAVARGIRKSGGVAFAHACDVTDETEIRHLREAADEKLGTVDILVNNAGMAHSSPIHKQSLSKWRQIFDVNVTGTFLCTRAFIPDMVEQKWGRIVNVASVAGRHGAKYISAYSASKHAVVGFTRSIADEVAAHGVTVNAICPGYVDTEMTVESIERIMEKTGISREQALEHILATNPQKRLLEVDEVAYGIAMLCDDHAQGINGQAIVMDGGGLLG